MCKLKKALYEIRIHPWDNTYMRSLKITWSDEHLNLCYKVEDDKLTDGCEKNVFKIEDLSIQ